MKVALGKRRNRTSEIGGLGTSPVMRLIGIWLRSCDIDLMMAMPTEPASEGKSESNMRLRNSSVVFSWAAKIGFYVLLYFVGLLLVSIFANTLRAFWMLCFALSLFALCGHFVAWLILYYRSMGYGISGSFLYWEYWLLAIASGTSTLFAFSGYQRYLVLFLLVAGAGLSTQFVPLLWFVPVRAIGRSIRPGR